MNFKNIPEGETLQGYAQMGRSDAFFVALKRGNKVAPFIVRGYDSKREEFYAHQGGDFIAFVDLHAAKNWIGRVSQLLR